MALLKILEYPDPRLHTVAKPVAQVDQRIRRLAADMTETMYAAPGIGLAATQVDVHEQLIVIDLSESKNQPLILINPELLLGEGEQICEEGCLSVPDYFDRVKRFANIRIQALNQEGDPFTLDAEGLLAVCIQHEMDHLKGIVFVDYLSPLKQTRLQNKFKKRKRGLEKQQKGRGL